MEKGKNLNIFFYNNKDGKRKNAGNWKRGKKNRTIIFLDIFNKDRKMKNSAVHGFKQKKKTLHYPAQILKFNWKEDEKPTKSCGKCCVTQRSRLCGCFPCCHKEPPQLDRVSNTFPQTFIFENGINTPSLFPKLPQNRPITLCENQYLHLRSSLLSKELTPTMMVWSVGKSSRG